MNVDFLLEGGLRRAGDRVRISVRLVRLDDDTLVWSDSYELLADDVFLVQQAVAVDTAEALAIELLDGDRQALARAGTTHTGAYREYLSGRYELHRFDAAGIRRAIDHFRRAVRLDRRFALAQVGLAEAYNRSWQHPSLAKQAAHRALELHPDLAEAHAVLGYALFYFDWDFESAERELQRAIALHPGLADAHHWYAALLSASQRHEGAVRSVQQALSIDPLSRPLRGDLGFYYLYAGRYEDAITECRALLKEDDAQSWARDCLIRAHQARGEHRQALEQIREGLLSAGVSEKELSSFVAARPADALEQLQRHRLRRRLELTSSDELCPLSVADAYSALGDTEDAFRWLDKAFEARLPGLVFLNVEPRFEPLKSDPRFQAYLDVLGL